MMKKVNWPEALSLLALFVGIAFAWNTIALYPLKILVVFFHELSHGLAALVTGGSVVDIEVVQEQGGLCRTQGGSPFLILTAGYLGSLIWGGLLLMGSARTKHDRALAITLGAILLASTILWVRPLDSFGFAFGLLAAVVIGGFGFVFGHRVNEYVLKIIGLTSCAYAILDIKSDVLDRSELPSDARMLADETGIPTELWGVLWIGIAIVASFYFVVVACRKKGESSE